MPDKQRLLELALKGLEAERATIDEEIIQIKNELGLGRTLVAGATEVKSERVTTPGRKKRRMSVAVRRKISEAMKRRYAATNKTATKPASQVGKVKPVGMRQGSDGEQKGGSRLTAAGRKKLSDLMKKRWADRRKGKMK
jgi:hypothetical protein